MTHAILYSMRKILCLMFASYPLFANVPGGIAKIPLGIFSETAPQVYYQDARVLVIPSDQGWVAIVGIALGAHPGMHDIRVIDAERQTNLTFSVKDKNYPTEHLTIKNQRKVEPLAEDTNLIAQQYAETVATYKLWRDCEVNSIKLTVPVKGRFSSPFGYTRIMNNIPKSPHSGLDIAASKGTPVRAASAGIVSNIGDYFYSGKIVFIDHGQSFITSYCHLDSIAVTKGQKVAAGDIIGSVGNTGRATGPHLHWSVSLNGVRVDPQLLLNG